MKVPSMILGDEPLVLAITRHVEPSLEKVLKSVLLEKVDNFLELCRSEQGNV